ncbi:choline kinase cytoplasm [Hysterangium stoloniferum]|nr:choline kinase cytoplasm [Hysterangium stoloniferum]
MSLPGSAILTEPPLGAFAPFHHAPETTKKPQVPKQAITAKGLTHAPGMLDARAYKLPQFKLDLLKILSTLHLADWERIEIPAAVLIEKVSGSLTNAIFFVSYPGVVTLLLRIYGPSSSSLISRTHELNMLHVLSSRYGIGPRVYGTFDNGRVEEYFSSTALTPAEMRDKEVSRWVGMRMAELHRVDLMNFDWVDGSGSEGVKKKVRKWLAVAKDVVRLAKEAGSASVGRLEELDLDQFGVEWERYWVWLMAWEREHGRSPRVFAHNDTQYGNLLRLKKLGKGEAPHHRIIVVDFEYASLNPAAFDIGNHFHEWTADYHGTRPHELDVSQYPSKEERYNFYGGYLETSATEENVRWLDASVMAWSAASHGMWAVWGVVQGRDDVLSEGQSDFDYVGYAASRMRLFRASSEFWV